MATTKVTITLPTAQLERLRALVAAGAAASVSGYIQGLIDSDLDDGDVAWRTELDAALARSGGPPTAAEREWVDSVYAA